MTDRKPAEKRLTPMRHMLEWLAMVAQECASNAEPASMAGQMKLMASELSLAYPESTFTAESAKAVAMGFQFGWPTVVQMRKALDGWRKEQRFDQPPATLILSQNRLDDPRFATLKFEEKSWLAFWDRRIAEIASEPDPKWDSPYPDVRIGSKRGNLASLLHTYGGADWPMIAMPYGSVGEIPEAQFIRERYENMEPKPEEWPVEALRQPRAGDDEFY